MWHPSIAWLASASGTKSGYTYFEDHFPEHEPAPRYATWEDQQSGATATDETPQAELTEHEKLVKVYEWKKEDDKGTFFLPENFGWTEEWGPEPGERGHTAWYNKERQYMSTEEKFKSDMGLQKPLQKYYLRHQKLPIQGRLEAAYSNLQKDKPMWSSTKDKGVDTAYTTEDKADYMVKARNEYMTEWLEKPGVNPSNVSKAIADYNGTSKQQNAVKAPRRPEWELAPRPEFADVF